MKPKTTSKTQAVTVADNQWFGAPTYPYCKWQINLPYVGIVDEEWFGAPSAKWGKVKK